MLTFTDKAVGTIQIPLKVTEEDIENIIVTSFEGGSDYWMGLDNSTPEWKDKPEDEPNSTWATKILLEGGTVIVYDIEDGTDTEVWSLTLVKLLNGISLNYLLRPHDPSMAYGDAITADCIVQYALFKEVVYG